MPATWTGTPRDWDAGLQVTSTIANTEWRNRFMYLKDSPTFDGSIVVMSTATILNLSVTGTTNATGAVVMLSTLAVTGAITATGGVVGNVTGNVTGNASGTAATVTGATQAAITTAANLVTVGALNSGSITSGFGAIDIGADALTAGAITATTATIGGILGSNVLAVRNQTLGSLFSTDGDTTSIVSIESESNNYTGNMLTLDNGDTSPAGKFVTMVSNSVERVAIDAATGAITAGAYNGQTISSTASFTGTVDISGAVTGGTYNGQTISSTANFDGTVDIAGAVTASRLDVAGGIIGTEQLAPSAPAANKGHIFFQDNGGGKTQLMVIFSSGAAQQIAIQP